MPSQQPPTNILGLDVGHKRVGVARVNTIARLPEPLAALANDTNLQLNLKQLADDYSIDLIVVGLPRSMNGTETAQSAAVRAFCASTLDQIGVPYVYQDETLTTVVAEDRLGAYNRQSGELDSAAAGVILEDYLAEHI